MRIGIPALFAAACLTMAFANGFAMGAEEKKADSGLKEATFAIEGMT